MIFVVVIVVFLCPITARVVNTHNVYRHGVSSHYNYQYDSLTQTNNTPRTKPNKQNMDQDVRNYIGNGTKNNIGEGFSLFMEDDTGHLYRHDSPTQTLYYFKPKKSSQTRSRDHAMDFTKKHKGKLIIKSSTRDNFKFIGNSSDNEGTNIKNKLKSNIKNHFGSSSSSTFGDDFGNNFGNEFTKNDEGNENNFQGSFAFENDGKNYIGSNIEYPHDTEIDTKNPSGNTFESTIEHTNPKFEDNMNEENDGLGHKEKKGHGRAHSSQYVHRHVDKVHQVYFHENDHKPSVHENHKEHKKHYDYHAHPKYKFGYKIEDTHTGDKKSHHEHRDGDIVQGHYEFKEPDGTTRTVEYHADKLTGFHANVQHNKHHIVPRHHHLQEDYHH